MNTFQLLRRSPRARHGIAARPIHPVGADQRTALQEALGYPVQTRLKVGAPDDAHEREAEAVADRVMAAPEPVLQRECAQCTDEKDKDKPAAHDKDKPEDATLQRLAQSGTPGSSVTGGGRDAVGGALAQGLASSQGGGQSLPRSERSFFESRLGVPLGAVRVHTGPQAAAWSEQLGARAFTLGRDVYFGAGEYQPGSATGRHLLAHELTHVLQQSRGDAAAIQRARLFSSTIDIRHTELRSRNFTVSGSSLQVTANAGYANPATCGNDGYDIELKKKNTFLDDSLGSQHFPNGVSATQTWSGLEAGGTYYLVIRPTNPPNRPDVCALTGSITVDE